MMNHIQNDVSLQPFNTFGVDARCKQFISIEDESSLSSLFSAGHFTNSPFLSLVEAVMCYSHRIMMVLLFV